MRRQRILEAWARTLAAHQRIVLVFAALATVLSLGAGSRLEMRAGRIDLLGEHDPVARAWLDFARDFGSPNGIVLLIGGATPAEQRRAVDTIHAHLEPHRGELYRTLLYRLDADYLERFGAYYLAEGELSAASEMLALFHADEGRPTWSEVFARQERLFAQKLRRADGDAQARATLQSLAEFTEDWATSIESATRDAPNFRGGPDAVAVLPSGSIVVDDAGYLVSNDRLRHMFLIDPEAEREDAADFLMPFMETIGDAVAAAEAENPEIHVLMTGMSAYAYTDLRVMQRELPWLTLFGLAGVLFLFRLAFGSLRPAFYAGVALLLATLWTVGLTAATIGHLTLLSSVFGLILIGLGIDYGIHLLSRYREERRHAEPVDAMVAVFQDGVNGILTGGLTTAAAFALCAVSDFAAFRELGLITAMGIGCSLVSMLTVLPVLILRREALAHARGIPPFVEVGDSSALDRAFAAWGNWLERRPSAGIAAGIAVAVFVAPQWSRVPFDHNFLHMQPADSPYPHAEHILETTTPLAPQFDIVLAESQADAAAQAERLAALPTVRRVTHAGTLLPPDPAEHLTLVRQVRAAAANAAVPDPPADDDVRAVTDSLQRLRLRFSAYARSTFAIRDKEAAVLLQRVSRALDRLWELRTELAADDWTARQMAFLRDLGGAVAERITTVGNVEAEPPALADLPADIRTRFQGASGRLALYVIPAESLWDRDFLLRFNRDVASVTPTFTGMGALLEHLIGRAAAAPGEVGGLAIIAILILLAIDFQHIGAVLAASGSLAMGILTTFGCMHLLGLQFNPMNVLALPLLLGIGIDNSVHVLHRARTGTREPMGVVLRSTGKAVFIASATTVVSFGLLALSTHRGLRGFGLVMALGVTACYAIAIVLLPCVWQVARRLASRLEPARDTPHA